MNKKATKYRGIIPFSGGIDSTAALYLTLTQYPDDQWLVFRVNLLNGSAANRMVKEEQAVIAILDSLRSKGINNFTYRRLSFDYAQLGPPPVWDSEVVNFAAATCIRAHPEITEFIEGAIADDYEQERFDDRIAQISKILYLVSEKTAESLQIKFPLKDKYKDDVMRLLPKEILRLTWSCRYPEGGEQWTLKRCHKCHTCQIIDAAIDKYPDEFATI